MDSLRLDLVFAWRTLRKSPLFTLLALVILALGIGVNSIAFNFVDAFLLRPLPFGEPERLVHLWGTHRQLGWTSARVSVPTFLDWRAQTKAFEDLAAFNYTEETLTGVGDASGEREVPERIPAARVSANAFDVLDARPTLGRTFVAGEDQPGAEPVAVLSHAFWRERFAGADDAIGRTIRIDGVAHAVVGVMPAEVLFPLPITEVWLPRTLDPERQARRNRFLQVFGRLKPGVSPAAAQSEMDAIAARLESAYPDDMEHIGVRIAPLREALNFASEVVTPMSVVLVLASGFVLLIVCANLANLMLSRAVARGREVSIRLAVGAHRGRLIRQMLTESSLLALAGGALGVLVASWAAEWLDGLIPPDLYRIGDFSPSSSGLLFATGVALASALLFGLVPALRVSGLDVTQGLKEGRAGSLGRGAQRSHAVLVVTQVALALALLAGCSLMIRTFDKMRRVDPGFDADRVLSMKLILPDSRYEEGSQVTAFQRDVLAHVAALPGVESAAWTDLLPLNHETSGTTFEIAGRGSVEDPPGMSVVTVSPQYFRVMGIPVLHGRPFSDQDTADAPWVVVVNDSFARRYWANGEAVGQRLVIGKSKRDVTIAGVVADSRHAALDDDGLAQLFFPQAQSPDRYLRLLVRTTADPTALGGPVREAIRTTDPLLPITEVRTLAGVVDEFLLPQWSLAIMLGVVGLAALVLASLGIYGVMAFFVGQRRQEIAVRLALGARREGVVGLVVRRGLKLTAFGIAAGLGAAVGMKMLMESFLFQLDGFDPVTFVGVPLVLVVASTAACLVPARRASAVDPMHVLRYE